MRRTVTKRGLSATAVVVVGGLLLPAGPVLAQGAPQTLERVDVQKVATGYRASKIIGSSVVNRNNDKIGTIDDLIVEPSKKVPYAVLSVGGFLGVGDHLVAVPFNSLHISENKIELPGATKDELKALPEFRYTKR